MTRLALRIGAGTLRGMRVLWTLWALTGLVVVGWEASLGVPGHYLALVAVMFVALPFSVVVHELGHAWAALAVGYRGIRLEGSWFAIAVTCPEGAPREDAVVALGGPLMSAAVTVLLVALGSWTPATLLLAPTVVVGAGALSLVPFAADGRTFWTWAWVAIQSGVAPALVRLPGRG